jgi:hypothetical protein
MRPGCASATTPSGRRRFQHAEEHQRRAQEHFGAGRFAAALSELRASKDDLAKL